MVAWGARWGAAQEGSSSFSDLDIEFAETRLTLQTVTEENQVLRNQLQAARESVSTLTESLAIATSEAEVFRRQYAELRLRMEALGLGETGSDKAKLEQRLLKAVQNLELLREKNQEQSDQLVRLTETLLRYVKTARSDDAQVRLDLEAEVRRTNQLLGGDKGPAVDAAAVPSTLTDGMVISVKEEYSLVVANLGSRQGVKVGMPFEVWRDGRQIGVVRVVDVREKISGAVIQHLSEDKEKVKVGDRLRVETRY